MCKIWNGNNNYVEMTCNNNINIYIWGFLMFNVFKTLNSKILFYSYELTLHKLNGFV
jgi:hypothetical protein